MAGAYLPTLKKRFGKITICFSKIKWSPLFIGFRFLNYILHGPENHRANDFIIFVRIMENQQQLDIELSEEIAEGIYSNLAIITHSQSEFVLDFVRIMPGVPKAKVKSRIVLTPAHAKRLMMALMDNMGKYEDSFGVVEGNEVPPMPLNFGGPAAQA